MKIVKKGNKCSCTLEEIGIYFNAILEFYKWN